MATMIKDAVAPLGGFLGDAFVKECADNWRPKCRCQARHCEHNEPEYDFDVREGECQGTDADHDGDDQAEPEGPSA